MTTYRNGPHLLTWPNGTRQAVDVVDRNGQLWVVGYRVYSRIEWVDALLVQGCTLTPTVPAPSNNVRRTILAMCDGLLDEYSIEDEREVRAWVMSQEVGEK